VSATRPKYENGELRFCARTRDRFKVEKHDRELGCVDVTWITGPEKGLTHTYLEGWVTTETKGEKN
jgi:hypothetical protein